MLHWKVKNLCILLSTTANGCNEESLGNKYLKPIPFEKKKKSRAKLKILSEQQIITQMIMMKNIVRSNSI